MNFDREKFRTLATGIDTMTFTAPLRPSATLVRELQRAKEQAQDRARAEEDDEPSDLPKGIWELNGARFEVSPSGCTGYSFGLLSEDHGNIWVSEDHGIKCELGSFPLWHKTPRGAYLEARAFLRALFDCGDAFPCSPTRIDLCVDFQGWEPTRAEVAAMVTRCSLGGEDEEAPRCPVCKRPHAAGGYFCTWCGHRQFHYSVNEGPRSVVAIRRYWERSDDAGRDWSEEPWVQPGPAEVPWSATDRELGARRHGRGQKFTGWTWGGGMPLLARLYNKSVEIRDRSPTKVWFYDVYGKRYDARLGAVWRLELQCRRQFLRMFTVDGVTLETIDDYLDNFAVLWQHLVGLPYRRCVGVVDEEAKPKRKRKDACGRVVDNPRFRICRHCGGDAMRPRGWLELRVPNHQKPDRWRLHQAWVRLQVEPFVFHERVPEAARRRQAARIEVVAPQAAGCLSTLAAEKGLLASLRRELGREPEAHELYDAACVELASMVTPAQFGAQVAHKDALRTVEPALTTRYGEHENSEAKRWRAQFDDALHGRLPTKASPMMKTLGKELGRGWQREEAPS